jgi:undecaprenyl-diphosphatase
MDTSIVVALHQWVATSPFLTNLTLFIAQDGIFLLPLALLAFWVWPGRTRPGRREAVLASILAGLVGLVLVAVVGHLVDRSRPFVVLGTAPLFPHPPDSSFPSDHTLIGLSLALPFLWLRPRWGIWLTLWALLVGVARVASALHYPTDVLGSALLAMVAAAAGLLLGAVLRARLPVVWRRVQASRR